MFSLPVLLFSSPSSSPHRYLFGSSRDAALIKSQDQRSSNHWWKALRLSCPNKRMWRIYGDLYSSNRHKLPNTLMKLLLGMGGIRSTNQIPSTTPPPILPKNQNARVNYKKTNFFQLCALFHWSIFFIFFILLVAH
jgi:hypothetical protein